MLVSSTSPAPRSVASRAHATRLAALDHVTPTVDIDVQPAARRFASMAITTHCAPNTSASSPISSGRARAAELTETLSAPASRTAWASSTERMPPPITNGMKTLSAVRRASCTIVSRRSCEAVMSRKTSSSAPSAS